MQQPPQQPLPQQAGQFPSQPSKRKRRLGIGCGITIAVVIVIVAIVAVSASHGGQASTNNTGATVGQTTQASNTNAPQTHTVGQSVTINGWVVTINSAKTSQGGQFSPLKSGDTFLELDVTAKNETGSTQTFSSLVSFTLKDSTGQSYNEAMASDAPASPNGNVTNGSPIRGTLAYEVPVSIKSFTLDFTPSIGSTDTATWTITVK